MAPTTVTEIAKLAKQSAIEQGLSQREAQMIYVQALRLALRAGYSTRGFGRSS